MIFWWYMGIINCITFVVRGIDKYRAIRGIFRIPEKILLLLVIIGGLFGSYIGMKVWRHKTIKGSFLTWYRLIMVAWVVVIVGVVL
ncbi:MAG TPA: DUF1294 domain-containing protein [Candidatus Absconditabacterales bacterium]|nr:DUF1294 domain-containing protein [Candidatus Absconditabacterales bacterium]